MSEWHIIGPGEPLRCPNRLPDGPCGVARDRAGPETLVRVRVLARGERVAAGSTERLCTRCGAKLELQPCPTVPRA